MIKFRILGVEQFIKIAWQCPSEPLMKKSVHKGYKLRPVSAEGSGAIGRAVNAKAETQ